MQRRSRKGHEVGEGKAGLEAYFRKRKQRKTEEEEQLIAV